MATFRTTPPPAYLPPSREEMQQVANQVGVKKYAPDLVEDLTNLIAGGGFNPPSAYRSRVEQWARETLSAPDHDGDYSLAKDPAGRGYTKNREEAVQNRVNGRMRYHQAVCDFLQASDLAGLPGNTPLEQAMGLLKLLATQQGGEPDSGGGSDESLPIFTDNDNPEGTAAKLNEAVDLAESMSDDEKELMSDDSSEGDGSDGQKGTDPKQARKLAEDMLKGKDKMLEIARHLDTLSRMQVRRLRKVEPDPEGEEVRWRPMKHLGEISRIPQSEWALPRAYRMYRHITGGTPVRERCTRIEKKQLLYILIDCSGSMGSGQRIFKAGGILMNRLKAVIAGEAELYVRLFDTGLKEEHHAATAEEARKLMKHFTERNFSGGGTAIVNCVKAAQTRIDEILEEGSHYRPELCVITDGEDDTSSLKVSNLSGTKLHAFVVECKNQSLVRLAERSGGVGVQNL